ncbi:uncharacterized protein SCHCODRAFT_01200512 [Schizophyllum commune H4-8]|nr:uncharacterized protein SCHCODRAFT_01200512 [Schizophyllum commune H4-8]KAI5897087.1 hypothetical protein SCHCODRAFT_01200512 [Schizophyllum commune H4-8]
MFVTGLFGCSLPALAPDHHHLLPNRHAGYFENMNYTPTATTAESSASSSSILPPFFAASNSALSSFSDTLSAKGSADIDASQKAPKRRHDELDENFQAIGESSQSSDPAQGTNSPPARDTPPGSHHGSQTNINEAESGFPSTLYQEDDFGTADEPSRKRVRTDEQEPDLSSFDAETLAGLLAASAESALNNQQQDAASSTSNGSEQAATAPASGEATTSTQATRGSSEQSTTSATQSSSSSTTPAPQPSTSSSSVNPYSLYYSAANLYGNPYYYLTAMYSPASYSPAPQPAAQSSPPQPQAQNPNDFPRQIKPKRTKSHTVKSKSYSIPLVPRDRNRKPMLPLNVGIMTVISLGEVCTREHFHTERYIFPVGYEVTRRYLSTIDPHAEVVYHCTILDGGDGPKFQVIPADCPDRPIIAGTATGAWSGIVKQANAIRNRQHSNSVSGPDFFGLGQNTIKHLIQELPNAGNLRDYVWQNFVEGGPLGGRHAAVIPALPEEYDSTMPMSTLIAQKHQQQQQAQPPQPRQSYYPPHVASQQPGKPRIAHPPPQPAPSQGQTAEQPATGRGQNHYPAYTPNPPSGSPSAQANPSLAAYQAFLASFPGGAPPGFFQMLPPGAYPAGMSPGFVPTGMMISPGSMIPPGAVMPMGTMIPPGAIPIPMPMAGAPPPTGMLAPPGTVPPGAISGMPPPPPEAQPPSATVE